MRYLLPILATANFAAGLTLRSTDPVVPQIAADFSISIPTVATLASFAAIAYATTQLPLGAIADHFGKTRVILGCLVLLGIGNIVAAFATSFEVLLITRLICGAAAGGVFPIAAGLIGDLFPVEERRIGLSRVVIGTLTGNLLGASFSGAIADFVGWRGVLLVLGCIILIASAAVAWGFRDHMKSQRRKVDLGGVKTQYLMILTHPHARLCFLGALAEGCCIQGLYPYIAAFLQELGEPRPLIAGIVISGVAVGGMLYVFSISRVSGWLSDSVLMATGTILIASQIVIIGLGPLWPVQFLSFVILGIGFYLLHSGLQVFTTEMAPDARASAVCLFAAFFNVGLFIGPLAYGAGLLSLGKLPTLSIAALAMLAAGLICARFLKFAPHADPEIPSDV